MKKKIYQEPTTKVVKLQHNGMLMQTSATLDASWSKSSWDNDDCEDGGGN